jgi:hypothetical protein
MSGMQRLPSGEARGRAAPCKLDRAGFGIRVTRCVGETAPAFSVAISAMTNTPRSGLPIEPTECVSRIFPDSVSAGFYSSNSGGRPRWKGLAMTSTHSDDAANDAGQSKDQSLCRGIVNR